MAWAGNSQGGITPQLPGGVPLISGNDLLPMLAHVSGDDAIPVEDCGKIVLLVLFDIVAATRRTMALRISDDPAMPGKQIHEKLFQTGSDFKNNPAF
jgi:hypothetical protein